MLPETSSDPLITDSDVEERVRFLLTAAIQRRFWLFLLDAEHRQRPTLVPVDGIPARPAPDDGERLAPMLDFVAEAEGAQSLVIVHERPGPVGVTAADAEWARCLRTAAARAELPVRASILLHDGGTRWLAPDDWI
ncbi:MAG: hypothetical protein ABWZ77_01390 [Naasia sp.]